MRATIFAYADGTPMLQREFVVILKHWLEFCGLSIQVLKVTVSELERPHQLHSGVN